MTCSCNKVLLPHPWSLIPIDRGYSKYFNLLITDQFLRIFEQMLGLGEFRVRRGTKITFIIFSEMYRCFHGRRYK